MNNLNIITTNDGSHSIYSSKFKESYHSKHGSIVESKHVFINNGLLSINKKKIKILEIGFGTGLNALLTNYYCNNEKIKVDYHSIELYPLKTIFYNKLNFTKLIEISKSNFINLHEYKWNKTHITNDYFTITKHKIDAKEYQSKIKFDIIYFDAFSPEKQPELWDIKIFKKMYQILNNNGFLVTYCAKGIVKRTMKDAGFNITVLDGPPGKRQMTRANK